MRGLLLLATPPLLGWTPLRGVDGAALSPPATPRPLAEAGPGWDDAAVGWTRLGPAAFAPVATAPLDVDGITTVVEIDDAEQWAALVGDPALVGFTLVTAEDGVIIDADVVLNTARFRFDDAPTPDAWHRPTILAHELGHVLGLGHICGDAEGPDCAALSPAEREASLMVPRLPLGVARGPGPDDVAGLEAVSPPRAVRRPTIARVDPAPDGWTVRADGLEAGDTARGWLDGAPVALALDGASLRGADADHAALWTSTGQGASVALPARDAALDAGLADAGDAEAPPTDPSTSSGCAVAPRSDARLDILALLSLFSLLLARPPRRLAS